MLTLVTNPVETVGGEVLNIFAGAQPCEFIFKREDITTSLVEQGTDDTIKVNTLIKNSKWEMLLNRKPWEYQSAFDFWKQNMFNYFIRGGFYLWINKDSRGRPVELIPIEWAWECPYCRNVQGYTDNPEEDTEEECNSCHRIFMIIRKVGDERYE